MSGPVCRVCLVTNTRMLDINNIHLQEIYAKLANTKLITEWEDGMPRTVCYVCHRLLLKCHRFSSMAHKSNRILQDLLRTGTEIKHSTVTLLSLWEMHNLSVSPTQYTATDITDDQTLSVSIIFTPETVKEEPVVKEEETYDVDIKEIKVEKLNDVEIEIPNPELPLESHNNVQNDSNNLHSCFYCDICNKKIATKNQLIRHIKFHSKKKPYSCKRCHKKFSQKNSLPRHMRVHTGEKLYACDRCDKKFNQKFALTSHKLIHTGERPYLCNICHKSFYRKDSLNTHLLVHTGVKPYCCKICGKSFNHKNVFTRHMYVHIEKKPFSCHRCEKAFSRKDSLTNHLLVHTGEKPFSCKLCGKAFIRKDNLTKHLKIHKGKNLAT